MTPVIYPEKIETGAGPVTVFDPGFFVVLEDRLILL